MSGKKISVSGIPGNALGAYLNGAVIDVEDNAQDAVGDTMNAGKIIVHGGIGDAPGYAMRGGEIFVKGNAGYRAGIHMKAYREKKPILAEREASSASIRQADLLSSSDLMMTARKLWGTFPVRECTAERFFCVQSARELNFRVRCRQSPQPTRIKRK